jgi:hypothetical protein
MYIFGGRGDWHAPRQTEKDKYCSNIYYLDTSTKKWIRPKIHGTKPIARRSHSACMPKQFTKNLIMLLIYVLYWLQLCIMAFYISSVALIKTKIYIFMT